ncbi:glutathione S-transferase family protein [Hoeflea sp.]|uniref:glutathione S-transferase family protein n=1 Tax=Hoeflea sp. TaxID=1940281 RepID=UPI003B5267BD
MSGYTLYWKTNSGSMVVEAALMMIGVAFDKVEVADNFAADFKAINPACKIPVLRLASGPVIAESAAILLELDDLFPENRLLPPRGSSNRAKAVQWLIFMSANIYPAILRLYYPERHTADENAAAIEAVRRCAVLDLDRDFRQLGSALAGPLLIGNTMTVTDIYAAMLASWHEPARQIPKFGALVSGVLENPAVAEAWRNHGVGK